MPSDVESVLSGYIQAVLDALKDGVYISDRDGTTVCVNKAYEQLTGLRNEDLVGHSVRELVQRGVFGVGGVEPEVAHEAEAEAVKIRAEAEAQANERLNESLTEEILENKKIEKWNGELPKVTGDSGALINLDLDSNKTEDNNK